MLLLSVIVAVGNILPNLVAMKEYSNVKEQREIILNVTYSYKSRSPLHSLLAGKSWKTYTSALSLC